MALNSFAYLVGCCLAITSPTLGWWPLWGWSPGNKAGLLNGHGGGDPPAPPCLRKLKRVLSPFGGASGLSASSLVGRHVRSSPLRNKRAPFEPKAGVDPLLHRPTVGWTGLGLFTRQRHAKNVVLAWVVVVGDTAALHHLPVTPSPAAFQRVSLVGPNGATPVDTEYYQLQVRGRGAGRKANDLVLQFPVGAARIQPDWGQRTRIDRHGLWVKPGRVLGASARTNREELERCEAVHLCREGECTQPGAVHCKAYAAVD